MQLPDVMRKESKNCMNLAFLDKLYHGNPFGKERHSGIFAKSKADDKAPLRRMQAFSAEISDAVKKIVEKG